MQMQVFALDKTERMSIIITIKTNQKTGAQKMTSTLTQTLTETNMSKPQIAYAIAKAHLETIQAERNEICKKELNAYQNLTGNEADEIVDEIINNLTLAEIEAELKLDMPKAQVALKVAENEMIMWGKNIVMRDKNVKANHTPTEYEMVMGLYDKALNGHTIVRAKIIELTFNLHI